MIPRELEPEVMDTIEESAGYAAMDHSAANTAFVQRLIELNATGHMLDLGTGPGDIPFLIADQLTDARITAIDLSHTMLDIARDRLAGRSDTDAARIDFQHADVKALPFDGDTFDVVFSNTILHHIPAAEPMLTEAWRVLRPGGLLVIRDLFRPDSYDTVEHLVATHTGNETPDAQQLFRQSLIAAHTPNELEIILTKLGYTSLEITIDTDRHLTIQGRKP